MSDEQREPVGAQFIAPIQEAIWTPASDTSCELDAEGHCMTCSDEALTARVLHVDLETGLALVEIVAEKHTTDEIDITLVESVVPGDLLLVHGGVAIANL